MGPFSGIDISSTGIGFSQTWMDAIAHNVANSSTVRPGDEEAFRAQMVVAQERDGGQGVRAVAIERSQADLQRVQDPDNPLADEDGYVTRPGVDLATQMSDMIVASRTYQANVRMMQSAQEAYESTLRLGSRQ